MKTSTIRLILASVATLGFFAVVFALIYATLDPTTETVLKVLAGALVAIITQVFVFYFGSSQSSKDKTDIMAHALGNGK